MNSVCIAGNLGMDPELRFTQNSQAVLRMRLATTESYVKRGGERQERTEWHTVIVWGNRAEALNKILSKGSAVAVEGRIQYRQWEDKDGNKRSTTEVVARNVTLQGGRGGGAPGYSRRDVDPGAYEPSHDPDPPVGFGDDDIPF